MKGYYKMPEATASVIDEDGWLHSGDLCVCDEDGYYKVVGRTKDMIIRGGENISPKELEECLYHNENVKDVQVVAVPDQKYGEEICACVILKDGKTMTEDEVKDYYRTIANVAHYKVPKYIWFVDSFPMNGAGKIQKFKLREIAADHFGLLDTDLDDNA